MDIAARTIEYNQRLNWFISNKRLPFKWFGNPEYIAIETPDIAEFQDLVERPKKERVILIPEEDDRFVVAAKLAGAFGLGKLGAVQWVKIEETPQQNQPAANVDLREIDFFVHEFSEVHYFLGARGIAHELVEQEDYYEIDVKFDDEGNRFCLISRPIEAIVGEMLLENRAQELEFKQAA